MKQAKHDCYDLEHWNDFTESKGSPHRVLPGYCCNTELINVIMYFICYSRIRTRFLCENEDSNMDLLL